MCAPIRKVEEPVEVFLHPLVRIALEIAPRVLVDEACRRDSGARRVGPQLANLLFGEGADRWLGIRNIGTRSQCLTIELLVLIQVNRGSSEKQRRSTKLDEIARNRCLNFEVFRVVSWIVRFLALEWPCRGLTAPTKKSKLSIRVFITSQRHISNGPENNAKAPGN
jgi:hypothetical protein